VSSLKPPPRSVLPPPLPPRRASSMPPPLPSPRRAGIGRAGAYEMILELASGGMATVFLARAIDGGPNAPLVALKRPHRHLANDKTFLSMLLDEARLASAIDHANVVKVRELGFEAGEPFIVLDYVEGASLSDLRKELVTAERAVDTKVAVRVVLDALAGLHAAHELKDENGKPLGIIHRDISPHNVLLGCDGRVRLTDFGIAKAEDRVQVTRTHEVKGKLAYLAPERIDRRRICTKQSDVFSMAVVLWECLAGRRLFRGEEAIDTLQEVMSAPIPLLRQLGAQVPPALDEAIARGLARDLAARYTSAAEFAEAIEKGAGRGNLGTEHDVLRVMETVFGPRLAIRHEDIRAVVGEAEASRLFAATGVVPRPRPTAEMLTARASLYAAIAPPAPSERYAFGNLNDSAPVGARKRPPWTVLAAIGGGVVAGAVGVIALSFGPTRSQNDTSSPAESAPSPASVPTVRRVVVPLPITAVRVTFDDLERTLDPPTDVSAFDVSRESGSRHRVVAYAADGTRAEAFILEADGVARAEDSGYVITRVGGQSVASALPAPTSLRPLAAGRPRTPPIGTVKNGFTKLK
jgi:serine/threonine-protein kinase